LRLPAEEHEAQPWVLSRIAPDLKLVDAWALPAEGEADDFDEFLEMMAGFDPVHSGPLLSRALFSIRLRLGHLFRWDDQERRPIPGCAESSLIERLPAELRTSAEGFRVNHEMQRAAGGFQPVFRTSNEAVAEISNATVYGVLQLGWVEKSDGSYRGQMGIYVKPRGLLGEAYMKMIGPFRHLIVYPAMLREIEQRWDKRVTVGRGGEV
jgi:hypothetical protein